MAGSSRDAVNASGLCAVSRIDQLPTAAQASTTAIRRAGENISAVYGTKCGDTRCSKSTAVESAEALRPVHILHAGSERPRLRAQQYGGAVISTGSQNR